MVYLLPIAYLETLVILPISVVMLGMLGNNLINHLTERNISRKPKFLSHMCRPNHTSFCAGKLGHTNNSLPIPTCSFSFRTISQKLPSLIEPSNGWCWKEAKFLALIMITDTAIYCKMQYTLIFNHHSTRNIVSKQQILKRRIFWYTGTHSKYSILHTEWYGSKTS